MRKISIFFLKYGPAIVALSCSIKIFLLICTGEYNYHLEEILVKYINAFVGIFIVGGLYTTGKVFHFCWKHRSLCRTALWGHIFYILFITIEIDKDIVFPLTVFYVILVLVMCLAYKNDL